jgi:hypothetical protein
MEAVTREPPPQTFDKMMPPAAARMMYAPERYYAYMAEYADVAVFSVEALYMARDIDNSDAALAVPQMTRPVQQMWGECASMWRVIEQQVVPETQADADGIGTLGLDLEQQTVQEKEPEPYAIIPETSDDEPDEPWTVWPRPWMSAPALPSA